MFETLLIAAIFSSIPPQPAIETDGVRVQASIRGTIYTYRVMNLAAEPINAFQVGHSHAYQSTTPKGWRHEVHPELFTAWATEPAQAIKPGQSAEFTLRVGSRGGYLGLGPVSIQLASGRSITIPNVWTSGGEPRSHVAIVFGLLLAIVLLHGVLAGRVRSGQNDKPKAA